MNRLCGNENTLSTLLQPLLRIKFNLSMKSSFVVGVDIGGTHITSALVDVKKGIILDETLRRSLINAQGAAEEIISSWCQVIHSCAGEQNIVPSQIGIAMPGPFEYGNGISFMKGQNKYDALYGMNIKSLLSERLSIVPDAITFANDAACFLQGEVCGGAVKGARRVLGLTLGTGFGSARFYKQGAEDADLWCAPFKDGIAEDYFSTRWFVKRYHELTQRKINNVKELMGLVHEKDCLEHIFQEFGNHLGAFLLPYVINDAIDTIIIGGNIANGFSYFSNSIKKVMEQSNASAQVKKAVLGENAALLGAASFCEAHQNLVNV